MFRLGDFYEMFFEDAQGGGTDSGRFVDEAERHADVRRAPP